MQFTYSANGIKLSQIRNYGYPRYDYIGPFIYKNNNLEYIITSEGRAIFNNNTLSYYEYHLKDHLGNVRVAYQKTSTGGIKKLQQNSYYPFGLLMGNRIQSDVPSKNKYLYNGKELISEYDIELNWYDYGARMYDPQLGRWHTQDAYAEKYLNFSPYQYAANNPIAFIDVNGDSLWISTADGNLLYQNGTLYSKGNNGNLSEYKGKLTRLDKEGNVKGYKGILGTTVSTLRKLGSESEFANTIISTLQTSDNNFTIKPNYNTINYAPVDLGNGKVGILNNNAYAFQVLDQGNLMVNYAPFNNIGSGGVINWNPHSGMLSLAHELGHSFDANFGMLDARRVEINGGLEEIREIRAVYYENRIRQDLGKSLRQTYSPDGPKLIDGNKNPIYYQTPFIQKIITTTMMVY